MRFNHFAATFLNGFCRITLYANTLTRFYFQTKLKNACLTMV